MKYRFKIILLLVLAIGLYVLGLGVRRAVLESQYELVGRSMPFTLESALTYRRVVMLDDRGALESFDPMIEHPDGINPHTTYTVGSEYLQVWISRLFPESIGMHDRLRWIEAGWFCLGIPLLGLWVGVSTRSMGGGILASLFYAVCISSVMRSTGQELSRENFALPMLAGSLAMEALAFRSGRGRYLWLYGILSSVFLMAALWMWDMIQFYVAAWALAVAWTSRYDRPSEALNAQKMIRGCQFGALCLTGVLSPYFRSHGFLTSPVFGLTTGAILILLFLPPKRTNREQNSVVKWVPAGLCGVTLAVLPAILIGFLAGRYRDAYSHFGSLIAAKIRFLNVKPADPSVLTFDQRIMWVPSLHSPDWILTANLMPAILFLSLLASVIVLLYTNKRSVPGQFQAIWYFLVSLCAYALFVRFHVFTAMFGAAVIGAGFSLALSSRRIRILLLAGVLAGAGWMLEAANTLKDPVRWGRPNVYYTEMKELAGKVLEVAAPDPVMANMGVSAYLATYGKCGIVLHPKFEHAEIRERFRRYGEALFGDSEKAFRDLLDEFDVDYYVYARGEFADVHPELQMRYFVNRMNPPDTAPAKLFESRSDALRYFRELWANRKYILYRMVTADDEMRAGVLMDDAREALSEARIDEAEMLAVKALALDPNREDVADLIRHTSSLREKGFGGDPEPARP